MGQAKSKSQELNLDLSYGWQGPTYLGHYCLPLRVHISRELESGLEQELESRHFIWIVGVLSSILTTMANVYSSWKLLTFVCCSVLSSHWKSYLASFGGYSSRNSKQSVYILWACVYFCYFNSSWHPILMFALGPLLVCFHYFILEMHQKLIFVPYSQLVYCSEWSVWKDGVHL